MEERKPGRRIWRLIIRFAWVFWGAVFLTLLLLSLFLARPDGGSQWWIRLIGALGAITCWSIAIFSRDKIIDKDGFPI